MDALKFLPQAFFDVIGRIIPGFIALLLLSWCAPSAWQSVTEALARLTGTSTLPVWLLLGISYVVGHLLSPATKQIQRMGERFPKKLDKPNSEKYDWLRVNSTEAGGHCAKLRAEFTLYNSLAAVFFIFAV